MLPGVNMGVLLIGVNKGSEYFCLELIKDESSDKGVKTGGE